MFYSVLLFSPSNLQYKKQGISKLLSQVEVPFPENFEEVLKNMNELRKNKVLQQNNKVLCEASEYLINLVSNQLSSFQVNEFNDSSLNKFENALTIANHWIASFK